MRRTLSFPATCAGSALALLLIAAGSPRVACAEPVAAPVAPAMSTTRGFARPTPSPASGWRTAAPTPSSASARSTRIDRRNVTRLGLAWVLGHRHHARHGGHAARRRRRDVRHRRLEPRLRARRRRPASRSGPTTRTLPGAKGRDALLRRRQSRRRGLGRAASTSARSTAA